MTTISQQFNAGRGVTKHFLYRLVPVDAGMLSRQPTSQEAEAVHYHYEYLARLTREGRLLIAGRTSNNDETTFGIVIFEAASEAEAQQVMTEDPALKRGVMQAELFPFRPAVMRDSLKPKAS